MDYKTSDINSDDDFDCSNGFNDNHNYNNQLNSNHNNNNINQPNSMDYNNGHNGQQSRLSSNPGGLSKAELRKTNKPIMEKRRRARINHCLNELKTLILEAMKKDPARHTKLEKADILEMTVKHLQSVQRQQLNMAIQTDPNVVQKFKSGFVECAEEVNRYIAQIDGVDGNVRQRLMNHLNSCATGLEHIGSMTNFNNGFNRANQLLGAVNGAPGNTGIFAGALGNPLSVTGNPASNLTASNALFPSLPQDFNNNTNANGAHLATTASPIQMGGVQFIPSRLPTGEIALIVPNTHATNAANLLNTNTNASNLTFSANWPSLGSLQQSSPASSTDSSNVSLMPMTNFSAQLQRMSAFSKPPSNNVGTLPVTAPLQPAHATIRASMQQSNATVLPNAAFKHEFHTTTAAAFHKTLQAGSLPQNSTTTTSPPLSPISSVSSHSSVHSNGAADDSHSSLMHTSVDVNNSRPTTPPLDVSSAPPSQQHSFSGVFATPPPSSAETSSLSLSTSSGSLSSSRTSTHLQQQQVSSTSGSELNNSNINNNNSIGFCSKNPSLKRAFKPETADSSDGSLDEPASKKLAVEIIIDGKDSLANGEKHKLQALQEDRENMWRPW